MKYARPGGWALIVLGLVLFLIDVSRGTSTIRIFLIIPVITTSSALGALAILMMFGGFVLLVFTSFMSFADDAMVNPGPRPVRQNLAPGWEKRTVKAPSPSKGDGDRPRSGGFIMLGPIPIVWGGAKKWGWVYPLAAILTVLFLVSLFL